MIVEDVYISNPDFSEMLEKLIPPEQIIVISPQQMHQLSQMSTPPGILSVCKLPPEDHVPDHISGLKIFYLDAIRDPGNLGTILRIADWFGLDFVICSPDCVDIFNHKVLQSSMGSAFRMRTTVMDHAELIALAGDQLYICDADGIDIDTISPPAEGVFILGNESLGVSEDMAERAKSKFAISSGRSHGAESLNVATASAVMAAWWVRDVRGR